MCYNPDSNEPMCSIAAFNERCRMTRIIFMGTPDFAVPSLQALTRLYDIVAVVTQPDRPVGRGRRLAAPPVNTIPDATTFSKPLRRSSFNIKEYNSL